MDRGSAAPCIGLQAVLIQNHTSRPRRPYAVTLSLHCHFRVRKSGLRLLHEDVYSRQNTRNRVSCQSSVPQGEGFFSTDPKSRSGSIPSSCKSLSSIPKARACCCMRDTILWNPKIYPS